MISVSPSPVKQENNFLNFTMLESLYMYRGLGAQWLSGRELETRLKGCGFEPQLRHCVVSLSKNINPSLVLGLARLIKI